LNPALVVWFLNIIGALAAGAVIGVQYERENFAFQQEGE
jgi:hypothetical protein